MTRFRSFFLALLLFAGLALLLTWPLPLHLTTHAPGDGSDDPAILWNLWWVRHALTELRQSPFQSAWMFWPLGINLIFYTLTTLNGLVSLPFQLAFGVVAANSAVIYFELLVAALGTWLLLRWLMAQHPDAAPFPRRTRDAIALLGALLYAFGSSKWLYLSLGQFNIAASHWLPWALLYLGRMWQAPTWRRGWHDAVRCALFVLFTGWTEFTYASFFIQFAALFAAWHLLFAARAGDWARVRRFTGLAAGLGALFVLGMVPILLPMVADLRANGDFLVEGLGFANVFSNDLLGFFVPSDQHPLFGGLVRDGLDFAYLNFAFVGWATLALALAGLLDRVTRRYAATWAVLGAAFALLSLGPTLRVNGREWELPLPFDLMLRLPILKANRYPSRYSVLIALCLAVLVTWGGCALMRRLAEPGARRAWRGRVVLGAAALLLLFEHAGPPLPLSDYRLPPVYARLAARGGAAVVDVPLAWRNGFRVTGAQHPSFMFAQAYQTAHTKRLLSGNTSRNPPFKFQYFTELPLVNSLVALETGHALPAGRAEADAALAPELLRLLDAPNLVVRRLSLDSPFPVHPARTLPYLDEVLETTRWHEDADFVGLEAALPSAPVRYEWDGAHGLARLFFGEGWSALPPLDRPAAAPLPVYATARDARLFLPAIAAQGSWRLHFESWLPPGRSQRVVLSLRDPAGGPQFPLGTLWLRGGESHSITLPLSAPRGPLTELRLRFEGEPQPVAALPSAPPFTLLVESAQEEVGRFAHIRLNGQELATGGTGYHAALLAPTGTLLAAGHFDTFNDPAAVGALVAFLDGAAPGTLLALAAEDTVSHSAATGGPPLPPALFEALAAWGATPASDMAGRFRWSHAFIGTKGAAPGTALEDASDIRPARLWLGAALDAPTFFARFGAFRLEPAD